MHFSAILFQINTLNKTFSPLSSFVLQDRSIRQFTVTHFTEEMRQLCVAPVGITAGVPSRSPLILFQTLLLHVCFAAESWHLPPSQTALGHGHHFAHMKSWKMPRLSDPSCSPQGCLSPVADGCGSTRAQLLLFKVWLTPPSAL